MALEEAVQRAGEMWSGADYERIAERFAPVHDDLVARLAPKPAERWLDVATGTGEVALRAARAGAIVTAVDIAEGLLAQARAKAERERLEIAFELGDAQALRFEDASFDVLSSNFGVIFAPDVDAAAAELARVCRPGGRLGVTAWREKPALRAIYERFQDEPAAFDTDAWSREERVEEILGGAFELEFDEGTWYLEGDSPEAVWEFMQCAAPPAKAFFERLDPDRRPAFREAFLEHWRGFERDGAVSEPRKYLIVLGRRR